MCDFNENTDDVLDIDEFSCALAGNDELKLRQSDRLIEREHAIDEEYGNNKLMCAPKDSEYKRRMVRSCSPSTRRTGDYNSCRHTSRRS